MGDVTDTNRVKVLIADDSADIGPRLAQWLEDIDGIDIVGIATDGKHAVTLFDQHRPAVMIIDQQMPELSGFDLVRHVRQTDPHCFIVCLTIHQSAEFDDKGQQTGINHMLDKSKDIDRLVEIVQAHLATHAERG